MRLRARIVGVPFEGGGGWSSFPLLTRQHAGVRKVRYRKLAMLSLLAQSFTGFT